MTGIIYVCIATLLVAIAPVLVKKGIKKSKPAIGAAFATTTLSAVCVFMFKNRLTSFNISAFGTKTWIYLLVSGLLTSLCILFLFKSAHNSEVMHFLPILKCDAVIVVLASFIIYKNQLTTNQWLIIAMTVVGAILMIIGEGGKKGWKWLGFALASVLCHSAFQIIDSHYLSAIDGGLLMVLRLIIATVIIWCVAMTTGGGNTIHSMSFLDGVILILAGAVFGVSMIFYSKASVTVGNPELMYIYKANLFVSMVLATLFLGEKITPKKLIGALLIIVALFL